MSTVSPPPLRPIATDDFAGVTLPADFGAAPMLDWIDITRLVVDESYQRAIGKDGRGNIRRIAENFRWSRFAPVIVAPIAGGQFAIIDGQHRTTAAQLAGHDRVPCQVIIADRTEQAAAFAAVNGTVTRINSLALFKAAIAAGEPRATRILDVARRGGAKILFYPKSELNQEPGETMAIGAIGRVIDRFGEDTVILALRCVVETPNRVKGGLLAPIILAMCEAVHLNQVRGYSDADLFQAFERINIIREYGKAQTTERQPGEAIWTILSRRLVAAIAGQVRHD